MSLEGGWRYVSRSGGVQGPIALDELRRLLAVGMIDTESQVHHRMMGWRWLGHVLFGSSYTHPLGRSHRATGIPASWPAQASPVWGSITAVSASEQGTVPLEARASPAGKEAQDSLQLEGSATFVSCQAAIAVAAGIGVTTHQRGCTSLGKGVKRQTVAAVRSSLQPAPVTAMALPKAATSRHPAAQAQAGQFVAGTHCLGRVAAPARGRNDSSEGPPPDKMYLIVRDDEPEPTAGSQFFANSNMVMGFGDNINDIGQDDILLGRGAVLQPSAKRQRREAGPEEANAPSGWPQPQQQLQHPRKPQLLKTAEESKRLLEMHEKLQVTKHKKPQLQQLQSQVGQERPLKHSTQQSLQLQTQRSASPDDRPFKDQQSGQVKPVSKPAPAIASLPAAATTARAAPAKGAPPAALPTSCGQTDTDNLDDFRQLKRRKLGEGNAAPGTAGKGFDNGRSLPGSQQQPMRRVLDDKRGSDIGAACSGATQSVASGSIAVMTGTAGTVENKPISVPAVKLPPPAAAAAAQVPVNAGRRPDSSTATLGSAPVGQGQSNAERSQSATVLAPKADRAPGEVRNGTAGAAGPSAAGMSARQARQGLSLPNIASLVKLNDRRPASLLSLVTGTAPAAPRPAATGKPSLMDTVLNLNDKRRQNLPPEVFLALEEVWQYRVGAFVSDDVCALELQDRVNRGELDPSTMATHEIEGIGCTVKKILEDNARAVTVVTCIRDNKPCPAAPLVVDVSLYEQLPEVKSAPVRQRQKPHDLPLTSASAPASPMGDNVATARSNGNGSEHGASKRSRQLPPQPPTPASPRRISTMPMDTGAGKSGAPPVSNGAVIRTPVPPPYRQPNTGYAPLSQVRRRPYRAPEMPQMLSNRYPHDGGSDLYAAAASVRDGIWGGLRGDSASGGMAWGGDNTGGASWGEDDFGGDYGGDWGGGGRSPSPEDASEPLPSGAGGWEVSDRATAQAGSASAPAPVSNPPLQQRAVLPQPDRAQQQPAVHSHSRESPRQPPAQPALAPSAQPPWGQSQTLSGPSELQPRSGWPQLAGSASGLQAAPSVGGNIPSTHPQPPRPYVPRAPSLRTQPQPVAPTQPPVWQPQPPPQHAPSVPSSDPSRFHTGGPRASSHLEQHKPSHHRDRHSRDVREPGGRALAPGAPSLPSLQGKMPPVGVLLPMHDGLPPGLGSEEPPKLPTEAVAEPVIASAEKLTAPQNLALPPHIRKQVLQSQQQRLEQPGEVAQSQPTQPKTQLPPQSQHQGQLQPQQAQPQPQNPPHAPQIQPHPSAHLSETHTQQLVSNAVTASVQQVPRVQSGSQAAAATVSMSLGTAHASAEMYPQTSPPLQEDKSQHGLARTTALPVGLQSETSITAPGTHALSAPGPPVGPERPDQAAATQGPSLAAAATAAGPTAARVMPPPAAVSVPAQASMAATPCADVASVTSAGGTSASPVTLAVTQVNPHTLNVTLNLNNKTETMEKLEMMLKMLRNEAGQSDTAPVTNPLPAMAGNAGGGPPVTAQASEPTPQAQSLADTATNTTLAQVTSNPLMRQPSQPQALTQPQEQVVGTTMLGLAATGAAVQEAPDGLQARLNQPTIDLTCPVIKPEPEACEGPVGPQMPYSGHAAQDIKGVATDGGCVVKGVVGRSSALPTTILKFKIYPLHLFFCEPYIPESMTEDWGLHPVRPEFVEVEDDDVDAVLTLEDQDVSDACAVAEQDVDKLAPVSGATTAVNEAAVDLLYKLLRVA